MREAKKATTPTRRKKAMVTAVDKGFSALSNEAYPMFY
jgi:hypothetical protein